MDVYITICLHMAVQFAPLLIYKGNIQFTYKIFIYLSIGYNLKKINKFHDRTQLFNFILYIFLLNAITWSWGHFLTIDLLINCLMLINLAF